MNLKNRIAKLESHRTARYPMVALLNADGFYDWNGEIFENKAAFEKALRDFGYVGKILILDD